MGHRGRRPVPGHGQAVPGRPASDRLTEDTVNTLRDNVVDVVGAGTLGTGIAQVAAAGHPVLLYDAVPGAAERAVSLVDNRVLAATIAERSWRALEPDQTCPARPSAHHHDVRPHRPGPAV